MSDDLGHDAHLRAALRHAPDHALVPPSGLSQTILAAARRAHKAARPTPAPPPVRMHVARARPWRAWWRRAFAPRWAGAWAAGLIATLGLGLWLDLEWQPAAQRPAVVAMSSSRLESESAARMQSARDATAAQAAGEAAVAAVKAAPDARAGKVERSDAVDALSAAPAREAQVAEAAAARRNEVAKRSTQQRAAESGARVAAAPRQDQAPPEAAAPPSVAPAPGAAESSGDRLTMAQAPAAPAPAPTATSAPPTDSAAEPATAARLAARSATRLRAEAGVGKAAVSESASVASPASTLLLRAQAELATGSVAWTWSPPGSAALAPFDAAAQAWLSRVAQASRGRWVDAAERSASADALEVRWWRDGWPHATLRIEADGVRWIEPAGRVRYAPLDAATLQSLRTF